MNTPEQFWKRVKKCANGCWEYQGHRDKLGYGKIRYLGLGMLAHRVAFLIHHGELPEGQLICHSCDNPPCCNPSHLWAGTNRDNTMDSVAKGRKFIPDSRGEKHWGAKLTADSVAHIREMWRCGNSTQRQIASQFGITQTTVSGIVLFKKWRHI